MSDKKKYTHAPWKQNLIDQIDADIKATGAIQQSLNNITLEVIKYDGDDAGKQAFIGTIAEKRHLLLHQLSQERGTAIAKTRKQDMDQNA